MNVQHANEITTPSVSLLTTTWAGDAQQFGMLRASLQSSALVALPHHVVVHTEDQARFSGHASEIRLLSTAEVLPGNLEAARCLARAWQSRLGRHGTKWISSLTRLIGSPSWPRYLGWQMQQITKLASIAQSQSETVLVLDSDVVVTSQARVDDYLHPRQAVCIEQWQPASSASGKARKWNREAHRLLEAPFDPTAPVDLYFDTPFPIHPPCVRALMTWLENRYQCPWWNAILAQPPRRWSEFATYRLFLRQHPPDCGVDWQSPALTRYVFEAADAVALIAQLRDLMAEPDCHYITLHSQSSGRGLWDADEIIPQVRALIDESPVASKHSFP